MRGQALVETVFFLPILLLALFALIFYSRLGVLNERSQLAARFAGNVVYQGQSPYAIATLQSLIDTVLSPSPAELIVFCTGNPAPGQTIPVQQAAVDALTQNEGNTGSGEPAPYAGPSAAPFFVPDVKASPSACAPTAMSLRTSQSSPVIPASFTQIQVSGTLNVPRMLQFAYGGSSTSTFSGSWNVVNVGLPTQLLLCNLPLLNVLEVVVGRTGTPTAACGS